MGGSDNGISPKSKAYGCRAWAIQSDKSYENTMMHLKRKESPIKDKAQLCTCDTIEKMVNDELLTFCKEFLTRDVQVDHGLLYRTAKSIYQILTQQYDTRCNHCIGNRFIISNVWVRTFMEKHQSFLNSGGPLLTIPLRSSNEADIISTSETFKVMNMRFLSEQQVYVLTKSASLSQKLEMNAFQFEVGDLPNNYINDSHLYIHNEECNLIFAIKHVPPETKSYSELPQKTQEGYDIIYLALEV